MQITKLKKHSKNVRIKNSSKLVTSIVELGIVAGTIHFVDVVFGNWHKWDGAVITVFSQSLSVGSFSPRLKFSTIIWLRLKSVAKSVWWLDFQLYHKKLRLKNVLFRLNFVTVWTGLPALRRSVPTTPYRFLGVNWV